MALAKQKCPLFDCNSVAHFWLAVGSMVFWFDQLLTEILIFVSYTWGLRFVVSWKSFADLYDELEEHMKWCHCFLVNNPLVNEVEAPRSEILEEIMAAGKSLLRRGQVCNSTTIADKF